MPRLLRTLALRGLVLSLLWFCLVCRDHAAPPSTTPPNGLRVNTPQLHALQNARVQVSPDRLLERATIVFRDGRIIAVGPDVVVPKEAQVWDLSGKTVYAGFIDAYHPQPIDLKPKPGGAPYWNERVRPQLEVSQHITLDAKHNEALRSQGIVAQLIAPSGAVLDGGCALVSTADDPNNRALLCERGPLHMRLTVKRGHTREEYPSSPMGAVALARQAMLDAAWYKAAWAEHAESKVLPRPERNDALVALATCLDGQRHVLIDVPNEWFALRAHRFAEEFKLKAVIVGSGREYRRLDEVAATGRAVIVPLDFPQPPDVASADAALQVPLASLLHWDLAPENPARLAGAGVTIAFTTQGLKAPKDFLPRVRQAVERGLSREKALAALTTNAAQLCQVSDQLGTIEVGKLASFIVTDGDLFDKRTKLERAWVEGKPFRVAEAADIDLRGKWELTLSQAEQEPLKLSLEIQGEEKLRGKLKLPAKDMMPPQEIPLSHLGQRDARWSAAFNAELLGGRGIGRLTAIVSTSPESTVFAGRVVWSDNTHSDITGRFVAALSPEESTPDDKNPLQQPVDRAASYPVNYPLGEFGVARPPEQPKAILFTHATIWTCGDAGVLEDASLLVRDGRIAAVGKEVTAPDDAIVIDCKGQHLTPGIIDCHSHMATDGGINEVGQAITAEVRVGDFIDPDDVNIYRQLAGGVTTINILHGSANPIGGQNQVCKLRWGATDEGMKFREAPPGIKFALGENVKQSNWGEKFTTRYPQSRMGVEQLMRDEFAAAKQYASDHRFRRANQPLPRRDLELEAIVEVLEGKRLIHCHSYRQDEILTLLKLTDEFKIQISTLQHILEGYKVADEIAKRGVGASAFSDWWGYKLEVYDAIPYNGAMLHNQGIVVSFNSDDLELGRHLNHEAAKATKYGGVPPAEALKFVTLNPARQLRIDALVGSLEEGKQADLVLWSGPPLSITSRCEQTWIEGRKYFDRRDDQTLRATARKQHAALVQKILRSGDAMLSPEEQDELDADLWPRHDEFCVHTHHDHDHDHAHSHEEHEHE